MWLISPCAMALPFGGIRLSTPAYRRSGRAGFDSLGFEPREQRRRAPDPAGLRGVGAPCELLEHGRAAVAVGRIEIRVTELLEDLRGARRQERRSGEPDEPGGLDEVTEDAAQALGGRAVTRRRRLREDPWLFSVDLLVRGGDERPEGDECLVEEARLDLRGVHVASRRPRGRQRRFPA